MSNSDIHSKNIEQGHSRSVRRGENLLSEGAELRAPPSTPPTSSSWCQANSPQPHFQTLMLRQAYCLTIDYM